MKPEKGFTLLEIVIGLVIGTMLLTLLAAAIPTVMRISPRLANKIKVEHELQLSRQWLAHDSHSAGNFIPLAAPNYGSFAWKDYTGKKIEDWVVTYYYDSKTKSLMRRVKQNGVVKSELPVARHILNPDDVHFDWLPQSRLVVVKITSTVGSGERATSRTATLVFKLRTTKGKS